MKFSSASVLVLDFSQHRDWWLNQSQNRLNKLANVSWDHSSVLTRAKNKLASFLHRANLPSTVFFLNREAMSLLCLNLNARYKSCTDTLRVILTLNVKPGDGWVSQPRFPGWLSLLSEFLPQLTEFNGAAWRHGGTLTPPSLCFVKYPIVIKNHITV